MCVCVNLIITACTRNVQKVTDNILNNETIIWNERNPYIQTVASCKPS